MEKNIVEGRQDEWSDESIDPVQLRQRLREKLEPILKTGAAELCASSSTDDLIVVAVEGKAKGQRCVVTFQHDTAHAEDHEPHDYPLSHAKALTLICTLACDALIRANQADAALGLLSYKLDLLNQE